MSGSISSALSDLAVPIRGRTKPHRFLSVHRFSRLRGLFPLHAEHIETLEQMIVAWRQVVMRAFEQCAYHNLLDIGHGKPFGSSSRRL